MDYLLDTCFIIDLVEPERQSKSVIPQKYYRMLEEDFKQKKKTPLMNSWNVVELIRQYSFNKDINKVWEKLDEINCGILIFGEDCEKSIFSYFENSKNKNIRYEELLNFNFQEIEIGVRTRQYTIACFVIVNLYDKLLFLKNNKELSKEELKISFNDLLNYNSNNKVYHDNIKKLIEDFYYSRVPDNIQTFKSLLCLIITAMEVINDKNNNNCLESYETFKSICENKYHSNGDFDTRSQKYKNMLNDVAKKYKMRNEELFKFICDSVNVKKQPHHVQIALFLVGQLFIHGRHLKNNDFTDFSTLNAILEEDSTEKTIIITSDSAFIAKIKEFEKQFNYKINVNIFN